MLFFMSFLNKLEAEKLIFSLRNRDNLKIVKQQSLFYLVSKILSRIGGYRGRYRGSGPP